MKLRKIFETVINELSEVGFLAYHGSENKFDKFTDEFVGGDNAVDQEGPGIYFTTSYDESTYYGKNIYTVKLHGNFLDDENSSDSVDKNQMEKLIRMGEDWEMNAQNWAEDPEYGLQISIKDFIKYNQNEKDVFLQIWIEYYRYDTVNFVRNMTKLGYDGIVVTPNGGTKRKHIIVYNPNIINFIEHKTI